MPYIDGFLIPIPSGGLEAYKKTAERMAPLFKQWGALRIVETIEDDCPAGENNDFHTAVLAKDGEQTVFSWTEWPDKETRNEAWSKMEAHMKEHPELMDMPFDGKRMIYGGFAPFLDQ